MDYKTFSEQFRPITCIISVETYPDGSYGNIRIVTGNTPYMNSMQYFDSIGAEGVAQKEFIPNQPYEYYLPKDLNFEDFCYRCAVLGQPLHSYVSPERYDFWIDINMLPIVSDKENVHYCSYTQTISKTVRPELMSEISPDIANIVLSTCLKLRGRTDLKAALDEVIIDIRDQCNAEHCCILLTDDNNRSCTVLCEALSKGTKLVSMNCYVDDDFYDIASSWRETIAGSTCVIVKNEYEWNILKGRNPIWYNSLQLAGAESIILFPLRSGNEILGYIWAINFNMSDAPKIKETLELTTYFIASEIANYQLIQRMETLSSIDMLTGVMNRNAMNNRIDEICSANNDHAEKVGIVFADLNGLKRVNDKDGHFAGDMLLKNAAIALQRNFSNCEIYRAGGDEFMVIAIDMDDHELESRVEQLRKEASDPENVCFAVGLCIQSTDNIRLAMRIADELMYKDKARYYQLHPEITRN